MNQISQSVDQAVSDWGLRSALERALIRQDADTRLSCIAAIERLRPTLFGSSAEQTMATVISTISSESEGAALGERVAAPLSPMGLDSLRQLAEDHGRQLAAGVKPIADIVKCVESLRPVPAAYYALTAAAMFFDASPGIDPEHTLRVALAARLHGG